MQKSLSIVLLHDHALDVQLFERLERHLADQDVNIVLASDPLMDASSIPPKDLVNRPSKVLVDGTSPSAMASAIAAMAVKECRVLDHQEPMWIAVNSQQPSPWRRKSFRR